MDISEKYDKWKNDILAIRKQVSDALELVTKGELSKSQYKKIQAKAYNGEREYLKNNPKPIFTANKRTVMSPLIAALFAGAFKSK